jgi:hypothetical protein
MAYYKEDIENNLKNHHINLWTRKVIPMASSCDQFSPQQILTALRRAKSAIDGEQSIVNTDFVGFFSET